MHAEPIYLDSMSTLYLSFWNICFYFFLPHLGDSHYHSPTHPSLYVLCLVPQLCLTLCEPMDSNQPGSSVHGISQARILEGVAIPFSRGSSQLRDQTQSPALQADYLPSEPPGKPKNIGVVSLALLQGSSWPRNQTMSCIADVFFTSWVTSLRHILAHFYSTLF